MRTKPKIVQFNFRANNVDIERLWKIVEISETSASNVIRLLIKKEYENLVDKQNSDQTNNNVTLQ
jgi:hypothetical protein